MLDPRITQNLKPRELDINSYIMKDLDSRFPLPSINICSSLEEYLEIFRKSIYVFL